MIINMVSAVRDRILIIESDPLIADVLGRQTLQAAGFQTYVVGDANTALNKILQLAPDAILASLNMPGLSGKDLLVAISSQGITIPVIVMTTKGMENDVIQAFRLGAADYLVWPAREPEIINSVERVLRQVRERRERDQLAARFQQANQELQARVRELTAIFSIGKAVTSITDQKILFEKILEGGLKVTQSDLGWFLLRDDSQKSFILAGQKGLPASISERLNQVWDDGISSLVALSGETLSIHGDPLKRFKISALGQAALVVPIRVQKQVIGLLVMVRRQAKPYSQSDQHLLEAVADYASISLVNAKLFKTVEERARSLQIVAENAQLGERVDNEILQIAKGELSPAVYACLEALEKLSTDPTMRWSIPQRQALTTLNEQLKHLAGVAESIQPLTPGQLTASAMSANLNGLVRQAGSRFLPLAQANNLTLTVDMPQEILLVAAQPNLIAQVLDSLISNAVRYCSPAGKILVQMTRSADGTAQVCVSDSGPGMSPQLAGRIFETSFQPERQNRSHFGGLGIRLSLAREIILHFNGKMWVETRTGQGSRFYFSLPLVK